MISLAKSWFRRLAYSGRARYCPICRSHLRCFLPYGVIPRPDAQCPVCYAVERHRLDWLFLQREARLWDAPPKSVLHVAPEAFFTGMFQRIKSIRYLSGDFQFSDGIKAQLDITALPCPSGSFDVIYCSHVLEHVPDDRRALSEFRRVLKPQGWMLLHIPPLMGIRTLEDPTVVDPGERERLFGQSDHVRRYGCDFADRLIGAGLSARFIAARQVASSEQRLRMGIPDWEGFWFANPA